MGGPEAHRSQVADPKTYEYLSVYQHCALNLVQGLQRHPVEDLVQGLRWYSVEDLVQGLGSTPERNAAGGPGFRWELAAPPTAAGSARGHRCGRGARGRWVFPDHRH